MNVNNLNNETAAVNKTLCTIPSPEALLSFLRLANQLPEKNTRRETKSVKMVSADSLHWRRVTLLNTSIH